MTTYDLILDSPYSSQGFFNFLTTSQLPRHRWYYFKEGFSASLVNEAIRNNVNKHNQKLKILDPFIGNGTSALTASLLGHYCVGIEVNPFLAFISQVKTAPGKWRRSQFAKNLKNVINSSTNGAYSHLEGFSTFTEKPGLNKWLFSKSVLRRFTSLIKSIDEYGGSYKKAFKLAALVAAFDYSNVRRDGKGLRYKNDWKSLQYSGKIFINKFHHNALVIIDDIENHPIESEYTPKIILGDSRKVLSGIEDKEFDIVITSPPYLNSFDYSDIYRPELFLGGFVKDNGDLTKLRLKTVRSHVQVAWPRKISFESELLTPILKRLNNNGALWNSRIPLMIKAYFDDLCNILKDLRVKLKPNGQGWIVISTSSYGGVEVPVDIILADIATKAGFVVNGIHCLRKLRTSGQQYKQLKTKKLPLRESLIIITNK